MQFMVMRRANHNTESGSLPPALEPGIFLQPSMGAVRLTRKGGQWSQEIGPFAARELVASLTLVEAESHVDAIDQVRNWPMTDSGAVFEIRVAGCPGGCAGFDERGTAAGTVPQRDVRLRRYIVFIRSDVLSEIDLAPSSEAVDVVNRYNERGVREGVLLAADGIKSSAFGSRVKFALSEISVIDGPFKEAEELIAGYWMLQAESREAAIEWAKQYPYATAGDLVLELREVLELPHYATFTPEMRREEQRIRAHMLEQELSTAISKAHSEADKRRTGS